MEMANDKKSLFWNVNATVNCIYDKLQKPSTLNNHLYRKVYASYSFLGALV